MKEKHITRKKQYASFEDIACSCACFENEPMKTLERVDKTTRRNDKRVDEHVLVLYCTKGLKTLKGKTSHKVRSKT
jgi:hypothetical protein